MLDFKIVKQLTGITDEAQLLNYADIEEAVRIGLASPVKIIPGRGILALIEEDGTYMLCASDEKSARELLELLPGDEFYVLCLHGKEAISYAKENLGLNADTIYHQFVYPGTEDDIEKHMACADGYSLDVRRPGEEVFGQVLANYDLIPEDDLRKDFENPAFLAGFTEGEFACFIGLHREGAMGLLRVFSEFRRRGYAEKIYSTLIYNQLRRGALPYCHVDVANEASIKLQQKLGFLLADQPVAWLVHEI